MSWKKTADFFIKQFVKNNKRLPTPAERAKIDELADRVFGEAFGKEGRKADQMSVDQILDSFYGQPKPQAEIVEFKTKGSNPKEEIIDEISLKNRMQAQNKQSAERMRAGVEQQKAAQQIQDVLSGGRRDIFQRADMRLIKNFEEDLTREGLLKEGYTPAQADVLMRARNILKTGEEMNPNEALERVREFYADKMGVDVEDLDPTTYFMKERDDFAGGGAARKLLQKLSTQSKSPFGKMAIKESGGALPKGVQEGSLMGDILESVNRIQDLIGNTKSLPQARSEIADFVVNMRQDGFSNAAIVDIVKNYGDQYSLNTLRTKIAPQVKMANDLGAKTNAQRNFIVEMEDTKDIYTPSEFRDSVKEGEFKYMVTDAMEKDFMAKGLNEEQAQDLAGYLRTNPENIFDGFAKVKDRAYFDFDMEVDDIVDFYEKAYADYVLPNAKRYQQSYAEGGIIKIIKKYVPKKSKKFPGSAQDQLSKKSKEDKKYAPSSKGLDVYERITRDQSRRDRTAKAVKDYRKGENVGKADSPDPEIQRDQSKVFPQNKKQLADQIKEINKDLIKERKENYKGLPGPKKRKTLRLKKAEGGLSYLVGF